MRKTTKTTLLLAVPGFLAALAFAAPPAQAAVTEAWVHRTGPWSTLATPTAPASSLLEYLDAPPPPGSAFYRTAQP